MRFSPHSRRRFRWCFPAVIVLVLIIGACATFFVMQQVRTDEFRHLLERSQTIAQAIDPSGIAYLSGSAADTDSIVYQELKQRITNIRSVNPDVRFVYLMGQGSTQEIFFYLDSEPEDSEDASPPGQVYTEASDVLIGTFTHQTSSVEGPSPDRWGNWISAFTPIVDRESGRVIAVVGVDIAAREFIYAQYINGALPALLTLLILVVLIAGYRIRRTEDEVLDLKSEFLSIAAHEIRTPLTGIRWASENILGDHTLTAPVRQAVTRIEKSAVVLIDRVSSLLNVSRLESGVDAVLTRTSTDMTGLVSEVIRTFSLAAQEKSLNMVIAPSVPSQLTMYVDRERMKQALHNILSNALKYSRSHGVVTVSYTQEGSWHRLHIADSGIGIPAAELTHVFTGYYRAKNARESDTYGSGFGLHLAQKIVEAHGGTLTVTSEEGVGTVFTLSLRTCGVVH